MIKIGCASIMLAACAIATPAIASEATFLELAFPEGQVRSEFEYNKDGTLKSCQVTKSSGVAEVDAVPCEVARRCGSEDKRTLATFHQCSERHANLIIKAMNTSSQASEVHGSYQ